jgi:2-dehydro-3-deoxyphosphooctonate aldolase (KDO 8-P synthase)
MAKSDPIPDTIVNVGKISFGNALPLALIAGPCALESRDHALEMASALKEITAKVGIGFVYKTSFDKANRTSVKSNRGIGLDDALPIFAEIRQSLGVPILTDVHESEQCARAAVAVGVAGVFIETHQDPDKAPSDGPNMLPLKEMEGLLRKLMEFDRLAKN